MHPENEHDPLSELLSGVQLPPADAKFREAIFQQTCGILWRRRLVRRITWIAVLASCWAAGVFSILAWQAAQRHQQVVAPPSDRAIESKTSAPSQKSTVPADATFNPLEPDRSPDEATPSNTPPEPAVSLTTFEKMRRAGDRQLNERGNLQGAIGCYRRALDFASDDELKIVPERDSWLLIPLKEARLEIRKHVHKKS